jgi:cold shock CspA family protein
MERLNGIIRIFHEKRGFGFIRITFKDQYYFHITEWDSDVPPVIGQRVSFEVQPAPTYKQNSLPLAVNVKPFDITKAAEVLGTGLPAPAEVAPGDGSGGAK